MCKFLNEGVVEYRIYEPSSIYRLGGKRLLDIALVVFSIPFWAPMLLVMICVTGALNGSPIYVQERVGRGGRIFPMFKIRTMVPDAEKKLQEHIRADPAARAEWDLHQKLVNDPRVTGFGRLLRMSSLDELPQFLNVLFGHMSIVGPRPMLPDQQRMYPGENYYRMRPGITCFWQISERNESAFSAREEYDSRYFAGLSLRTDLWIILRTFRVVFRCNGH